MYNLFSNKGCGRVPAMHLPNPISFNPGSQREHISQSPLQLGDFWLENPGRKWFTQCPSLATGIYWAALTLACFPQLDLLARCRRSGGNTQGIRRSLRMEGGGGPRIKLREHTLPRPSPLTNDSRMTMTHVHHVVASLQWPHLLGSYPWVYLQ